MSETFQKEPKEHLNQESDKLLGNITRIDHNFVLEIVIGTSNVKRWNQCKITFSCTTNEELATFLLNLAEKYTKENVLLESQKSNVIIRDEHIVPENIEPKDNCREPQEFSRRKRKKTKTNKIRKEKSPLVKAITNTASNNFISKDESKSRKHLKKSTEHTPEKHKKHNYKYDIRKAPELNEQPFCTKENNNTFEKVSIKIKLCGTCGNRHVQDQCPLENPHFIVKDSVQYDEWFIKYNEDCDKEENSYAYLSLPTCLKLHGDNVFTVIDLEEFTQFGPLVGKVVKEVDIPEEFNLKNVWGIYNSSDKSNNIYMNVEDVNHSNWIRFIRPAPTRDERNIIAFSKNDQLFLTTTKSIACGEELLYWQDDNVSYHKKKMEKTTCGGCNMTFEHALYYRLHCSIFHDIRYSLTIRKYHCKICGAAVLGKENIMKHAQDLHNGQGAYQCQFCKKFFLRLNYLDMHRTYGCSANPQRARPLCDFCGQKFCQPQKLKVHIKRMHSDIAEVLRDFQCKGCAKILGSRAALQRHMKEVHNKEVNGASACNRCGKFFQNKSNLKIHMLTHSGIKPFRCAEDNCNAAFTTKQCLQFHYKKVHGFSDDIMPKIKRSVDYTFEAYSGDRDLDCDNNLQEGTALDCNNSITDLNEESDIENDNEDAQDDNCNNNLDESLEPSNISANIASPATHKPESNVTETSPTILDELSGSLKIFSKGSKKWLGDSPLLIIKSNMYQVDKTQPELVVHEPSKLNLNLNAYGRHNESSNASLLVEAALDSVIDVDPVPESANSLVNNLCTSITNHDSLSDVPYNNSDDIEDSPDINLISPSVNEAISVTDGENMGIDYSNFHHNDFTPVNSPGLQQRESFNREFIDVGQLSPKNITPISSPPRYTFGHGINVEQISSDDSNGIGVQNLSLHSKNDTQLDLSLYKSPPGFDLTNFHRNRPLYILEFGDKLYPEESLNEDNNLSTESAEREQVTPFETPGICNKDFDDIDNADLRYKEVRSKYDISELRRSSYENTDSDFRLKYDEAVEPEFRIDRTFEQLELQGLDMSARSYHSFHPTTNLNRYHHLYPELDRPPLYSPTLPSYSHSDVLRVVSLDLTSPGRHSVDLSLRSNPLHQLGNSRLLTEHAIQSNRILTLDQNRLLGPVSSDLTANRHIASNRILSDHSTNRLLSNEQTTTNHLISSEPSTRLLGEDARLIGEQARLLTGGAVSPLPYSNYSVSSSSYHATALTSRTHGANSPTPYHHYTAYY